MGRTRTSTRHERERWRRDWESLGVDVLAAFWRGRVELALIGALVTFTLGLCQWVSAVVAGAIVLSTVAGLLAWRPSRHRIATGLHRVRVRRAWERAVVDAGAASGPLNGPRLRSVRRVAAGELLKVRVARGSSVGELEARRDQLAACLRVREVRVSRDRQDGALADVMLVRRDPFDDLTPVMWPQLEAEQLSLWDPIALGVDEHGEPLRVGLVERNVLVGGEPGAGKSAALSVLIAAGALDPGTRVWLLDGKLVELAVWAPVAERLVGPDGDEAIVMLQILRAEMEARYRELLARGQRKIHQGDGLPLHLVVVDELAFYLSLPDRAKRQEFAELLRDLVARGRAAGVIVLAATQKPGSDTVPTALRDLFGFRLALRCNTPQASDTILGQGWATAGADASTIPGGQRGVGYLLAEDEHPTRVKGFYLDDDQVRAIADRATGHRADAWLSTTQPTTIEVTP